MKVRPGLVSNSSSSSFVIDLQSTASVTEKQLDRIIDYTNRSCSKWQISVEDGKIKGTTGGDSDYMKDYLMAIGIDETLITWEYN